MVIYLGDSEISHLKAVLKNSEMCHLKVVISILKAVISTLKAVISILKAVISTLKAVISIFKTPLLGLLSEPKIQNFLVFPCRFLAEKSKNLKNALARSSLLKG